MLPLDTKSQVIEPEKPWIYFPGKLDEYKLNYSIGLTIARLPRPIVEEEMDQAPMLDFHFRYGLPYNFSLSSRISSIGITNHISAGLRYSLSIDKLSLSIGNSSAYWFGWADFYDFDARANGLMNYPEFAIGYDLGETLITLWVEAEYLFSMKKYSGNIQTNYSKSRIIGFSTGLFSEQLFLKNNWLTIGLKMRYSRFFYQSWMAFSSITNWFWTPEITLAYNL